MKILHVCLASFYIDNYNYQENMLPKYHYLLGHHVKIIASLQSFNYKGQANYLKKSNSYINENGIKVQRLKYKNGIWNKKLKRYKGLKKILQSEPIDLVFVHGIQFIDFKIIAQFKKKLGYKILVDNHADFSNSATNFISKNILHGIVWKRLALRFDSRVSHYFGVLPSRVDFLVNVYGLPSLKVTYLPLGLDDKVLSKLDHEKDKIMLARKYNFNVQNKLVITGGKIDEAKKDVVYLAKILKNISNVSLIIFGPVVPSLSKIFYKTLEDSNNIIYIPWLSSFESLKVLSVSDLVVFPGGHSVYWEQVLGLGRKMLVKKTINSNYLLNDNLVFMYNEKEKMQQIILDILFNKKCNLDLEKPNLNPYKYYYSEIARISLDFI